MTDTATVSKRSVTTHKRTDSHAGHRTRDWGRAIRAFQRLMANKEDTSQVFAIMHALNGEATKVDYIRLLATPDGGKIAYQRMELAEKLMDDEWRSSFPPGSVGAAYHNYLETEHLSASGLIDESHKGVPPEELDQSHPYAWYFRRVRDVHDIWHVLTGYGRDALGEMCLVAFSFQETHGPGWALIAAGGFLRAHGPAAGKARRAILEARRMGKHAVWLGGEDYETMLFEPLDDARRRLGIGRPLAYEAVSPEDRDLAIV